MFQGLYTAVITPFQSDESFDEAAFARICEQQIAGGVDGIVVLGTTGESPTISPREHKIILQKAVDIIAGRTKVIAGTGSNCTREAIDLSVAAQQCAMDGLLQVNPYYNKPTQEGMFQHFSKIADHVDIPIMLYNIAGRCGVNLETPTLLRLAKHPNIVAVKEASGNMEQIKQVIQAVPDGFNVLSGDDALTLDIMKHGGHGLVSVLSNAVPKQMKTMIDAATQNNWAQAKEIHMALSDLFGACFLESNPQPIKTIMAEMGFCKTVFRSPMVEMDPKNKEKLLHLWRAFSDQ